MLFLLFLFFPALLPAQTNDYQLLKTIPIEATLLTSDRLGYGYAVNQKQELLRINKKGEVVFKFNNNALGTITSVDANNALRILVYYADYSTIITLDNTLSQTGRINLLELGSNQVSAACVALDNNIWIYDAVLYRLRKIDANMNVLMQSEDLNALIGQSVRANFLMEKDNFLYVNDPALGILVFDIYGTYIKTLPLTGLNQFQKIQDRLLFFKEGKLFSYHLLTFNFEEILLPVTDCVNAAIEKDRLFVLQKNQLEVYSY
ncbi:MAG: hypothetical protein SH857_08825 [Chitinophagales bacterium]|nr:hypothetical protein [Chitinophagales bacterium]